MHANATSVSCFILLIGANYLSLKAAEPEPASKDEAYAEISQLIQDYEQLAEKYYKVVPADGADESDMSLTDEQWLAEGREIESRATNPDSMLPGFLAFAQEYSGSPHALDALAFVMRRSGYKWNMAEQAIDLVLKAHLDDPRVVHVFDRLSGEFPTKKTEFLLRHAYMNSSDQTIQAAAGVCLARYLSNLGRLHRLTNQINKKEKLLNYERSWKIHITSYLRKHFPYDREKVQAEAERILLDVIDNHSDVEASDWTLSGTGRFFLETTPFPNPKTYGDLAKAALRELNSLTPGKKALDIDAEDAMGNRFRLSDYQGKVVLLTFSANWCGGCVELYPLQRRLVEKFRDKPFALLSVSQDKSVDSLQASLESGEITWRCWWDGYDGPIRNAWNNNGVPAMILLDAQHIVQDVLLNRFTKQEEFEIEIAKLLPKESP